MHRSRKQKSRNVHPGEVLREGFQLPPGIPQYRLAKEIGVTEARTSAICSGKRAVTADYDTEEAAKELSGELAQLHRFEPLAA
jgi:plasmid maintenance system antidote protein VapI